MKKNLQKPAELNLVLTMIGAYQDNNKYTKGRMKALLKRLANNCVSELEKCSRVTGKNKDQILKAYDDFDLVSGWKNSPRHIMTYCSFFIRMFENYKYYKIKQELMEIIDYYERASNRFQKNAYVSCHRSGMIAATKWQSIVS